VPAERPRCARWLEAAAVGVLAALYFAGAIDTTIDWTDEGHIIYPSWRAGAGVVPYVGFHQLYGPSLFLLNGGLFRVLGPDLHVVRASLVVLKALNTALVYAVALRAASRAVALAVAGVLVAAWGIPMWVCNTPYASYYDSALCLAALLVIADGDGAARAFAAGLGFGLAATFKQTQGVFAFVSYLLFVLWCTPSERSDPRRALVGAVRLLVVVGALGMAAAYVAPQRHGPHALLVAAPFALVALALGVRELVLRPWGGGVAGQARVPVAAALGMMLPSAAYAAFYAAHGALGALVFDTIAGLPQRIRWFTPIPAPPARALALVVIAGAAFLTVGAAARLRGRPRVAALGLAIALGCAAVNTARLASSLRGWGRIAPYVFAGGSFGDVALLLPWLPFGVLTVGGATLLDRPPRVPALLFCYAAGAVLQLYPAADVPHAILLLPAVFPVLAYLLARFVTGAARGGRALGAVGLALAVAALLVLAAPFVHYRLTTPRPVPPPGDGFRRASGIWSAQPKTPHVAALVDRLAQERDDRRLLVTVDEQMLYFLAGIPSALERDEFVFYLLGNDLLSASNARALADEARMLATLRAAPPLVVDDPESAAARRFRGAFPDLARFLDTAYAPVARFGGYRLLAPRAGVDTPDGGSTR